MSCVDSVLRLLCRMNLRAASSTCDTRYSISEHRPCKTSSLREVMPTDSATSLMLSGFQTDMMGGYCCWEGGGMHGRDSDQTWGLRARVEFRC